MGKGMSVNKRAGPSQRGGSILEAQFAEGFGGRPSSGGRRPSYGGRYEGTSGATTAERPRPRRGPSDRGGCGRRSDSPGPSTQ